MVCFVIALNTHRHATIQFPFSSTTKKKKKKLTKKKSLSTRVTHEGVDAIVNLNLPVNLDVLCHVILTYEPLPTNFASERLLSRVETKMPSQISLVPELLGTLRTLVRLVAAVHGHVLVVDQLRRRLFVAYRADQALPSGSLRHGDEAVVVVAWR